ncbi:MAG: phosphoribosylanthranilate isomerase [Armatimonadetes bacterium]|nr:phosphoribosylanthranilate isomerase [Armatimonadota bacterium]
MTLIKVCGITNIDDALACAELGADFLGFVFADSPRRVEPDVAKRIVAAMHEHGVPDDLHSPYALRISAKMKMVQGILDIAPESLPNVPESLSKIGRTNAENYPTVNPSDYQALSRFRPSAFSRLKTVGVFTEESDDVLRVMDECGLDYAQLHGGQSEDFARKIGADRVVRVARVKDESSIAELAAHQEAAFYLLDAYKKGQPGGTGETFNWSLAAQAKSLSKPIFLSGGLNPYNVYDAIRLVRPYAVDVSSGVERSPGVKDINKVKEFIDHVREADDAS